MPREIDLASAKCSHLSFESLVNFENDKEQGKISGFDIEAYTGAVVERWWGKLVIEVSGIHSKKNIPIFRDHDRAKIVGFSTGTSKDGSFRVSGKFSQNTEHAKEVIGLAEEGFPWQASIGVKPRKIVSLEKGAKYTVNGKELSGPAEIWIESDVMETSFVALGADGRTRVTVFSEVEQQRVMTPEKMTEENQMNLESLKKEFPGLVEAITKEATAGLNEKLEAAKKVGAEAERDRIKAVLEQSMPGHESLVQNLAFDGKTTGPEAAVQVLAAERKARESGLEKFKEGSNKPVPSTSTDTETELKGDDQKLKAEWDKSASLQDEFAGDFEVFKAYRADVPGVRVKSGKK